MAHPSDNKDRKFFNASQESGYVQALLAQGVSYEKALKLDEERLANGGKVPTKEVKLVEEGPKKLEAPKKESKKLEAPKNEDA